MKHSIRTRITLGMIFLFLIILVLSVFSGYYMSKLSKKNSAILKENYLSVVYAREMTEYITNLNLVMTAGFLSDKYPDSILIEKELSLFEKSLLAEKNNITEPGEDKIVAGIENDFSEFRNRIYKSLKSKQSADALINLQTITNTLFRKLTLLSQLNGNAIESKTDDAKAASYSALKQMTILASACFLIGLSFTFSFGSYFNQRIFQLYNGIKELASNNFEKRLYFDGKDEFYEISLVFNEMAEKLNNNKQKMSVTLHEEPVKAVISADTQDLKDMLSKIKKMEEQAAALIARIEKNA
jgi:methyl-accepting chemotaxis protein